MVFVVVNDLDVVVVVEKNDLGINVVEVGLGFNG
jgi:hypothetical protein